MSLESSLKELERIAKRAENRLVACRARAETANADLATAESNATGMARRVEEFKTLIKSRGR